MGMASVGSWSFRRKRTMQRVRIVKSIGLIGSVAAFLLLCSAQPFQPAPKLYRAKPEDVPPWAEQGNFRFIRLDGGQIESWKAERTWWGDKFSAEEKEVLTHIYDRDFEQMLGLLKQAEFNWIWVTWSNGWSLKDEDENRENLKKVIARCHENGIHVSAYLSASNMFWKSAYRDDPETKKYGLWKHGIPMFYAGPTKTGLQISWKRRLADAREPGWRAYLLEKAERAVDAGVDAIAWDNMIGHNSGLAQLLDDTQRMAERKARETGRTKVMVEANIHIPPGRFAMNDINEAIWEEDGKDTPGVWDGHWQVDNARKIKFLSGEKQLWQPLKYENDVYHGGPRERCIPSPAEQKLSIAEAYAFGGATSRNIEGRFLSALIKGEPEAQKAWTAIAQYNHFMVEHQEMVVLSDGRPGLLGLRLALDQRGEESALDVARGGPAERIGLGDGKLLLGRTGDAALARAAVVNVVLILQGLPKLLLSAQELDFARVVHLPMAVPHPRSVLAILLPNHLVNVVHRKAARRNMDICFNHDLGPAGLPRLPFRHPLGVIEQLGQAGVVTDHVVPCDRVHSRVHRQFRLLQEIGSPARLARVGQPALP